jgi:hypothetical protein
VTALVAASRVFLGVHSAVDVVLGSLVGLAFLAGVVRFTDQRPTRTLALSTALGGLAFATSGTSKSGLALTAAAIGFVVWTATDRLAVAADPTER